MIRNESCSILELFVFFKLLKLFFRISYDRWYQVKILIIFLGEKKLINLICILLSLRMTKIVVSVIIYCKKLIFIELIAKQTIREDFVTYFTNSNPLRKLAQRRREVI